MRYKVITAPSEEPVTLDTAKMQCRVEHNLDDALINGYISAAREQAEHRTGRALITQTLEMVLDTFPDSEIELPLSPAISIVSVKYINTLGNEVTMATNAYALDNYGLRNWVLPASGTEWPDTFEMANAVKIEYTAGFGNASAVPQTVKSWILMAVGAFYEHRELVAHNQTYQLPRDFCDALLDPIKIWRV